MGHQPPPGVIAAARASMASTGIPASVQLAQWALESGWGAKVTGTFNYFGIKAVAGQPFTSVPTHEVINGERIAVNQNFANYDSLIDAFTAHAQLLSTRPQYAPARACLPDIEGFCDALTGVYATDPNYGDSLMAVINGSDLTAYDAPDLAPTEST